MKTLVDLFLTFAKIGLVGFGGGALYPEAMKKGYD